MSHQTLLNIFCSLANSYPPFKTQHDLPCSVSLPHYPFQVFPCPLSLACFSEAVWTVHRTAGLLAAVPVCISRSCHIEDMDGTVVGPGANGSVFS